MLAASRRAERARSTGSVSSGVPGVDGNFDLARDDGELFAGRGTVDVDRNELRAMAVFCQPAGEFAGGSGFAGTLEADDEEDAGRIVGEAEFGFVAAEDFDQLVVNDADDLLRRREGGEHFLPHGAGFDAFDELLDDLKIDVGFEQGDANFAQGRFHVFGGQATFAAHVFEDALQFVGEVVEHWSVLGSVLGVGPGSPGRSCNRARRSNSGDIPLY